MKTIKKETCKGVIKIKKLFSMGYMPSRENQSYLAISPKTKTSYTHTANCFAHACLNLTNEQLDKLNLDRCDTNTFDIKTYLYEPIEHMENTFLKRIQRFGLKATPCEDNDLFNRENQWKVALYFGLSPLTLDYDYHFLKQEKDGTWSSKVGWGSTELQLFSSLPDTYISPNNVGYSYYKTYIITNPFVEIKNETDTQQEDDLNQN